MGYVQGIPPGVDDATFQSCWTAFGNVLSTKLCAPRQGTHSYGFVQFASPPEAQAAVEFMDGFEFGGCALQVKLAQGGKGGGKTVGKQVATGKVPAPLPIGVQPPHKAKWGDEN